MQIAVCVTLAKELKAEEIKTCFNSLMEPVFRVGVTEGLYDKMKDHILAKLETFTEQGSGWTVRSLDRVYVNFARFNPMKVGSYIPTPFELEDNHFLLNIQTRTTNNCFKLCLLASKHLAEVTAHRCEPWSYNKSKDINICHVEEPVKMTDIDKIEETNNLSVNVFAYEGEAYPLRISCKDGIPVDLLVLSNSDTFHYCLITNFNAFMNRLMGRDHHYIYCRRCLHGCKGLQSYMNHKPFCDRNDPCRIDAVK